MELEGPKSTLSDFKMTYSKTCVREPPSRLTLNSCWCGKSCLSYKGTCHVILLAKLHDMYLYKTITFPHQPLKSISKVAVLHRFYCRRKSDAHAPSNLLTRPGKTAWTKCSERDQTVHRFNNLLESHPCLQYRRYRIYHMYSDRQA